ncbi:GntR family transcriptional regulator [Halothermothrix orenii]|uniref:Regulatory protein GntR HTH n=1 Tax=Halothermothrix orenii (strain H 168 / OCM 544 / DSM 9562) TaxID=373903 RepID=B8CYC7_HALOH|nr:GntR family transcriptional regulator [Halothermothrix orenii]ACL70296.1 regulatory protein GntR HTH [Halothermothrix orenii H 168]
MQIKVDRESAVPIYVQIKNQIKTMVERGILSRGDRLPPERELAEELKVSRNRVSTAYKELEAEGIVSSQQGKGTFIAGKVSGVREPSRKDKLLKIIDLAMEEAIGLGFSLDDFLTIAYVRAKEKEEMLSKIKVAFIECNQEQLSALMVDAGLDPGIACIPVLIGDLRENPQKTRKILDRVEMIVTTPFHLQEVEEFVSGMDKEVIDMNLEPKMDTIVKLARIKPGSSIGLICLSDYFAREVERSLTKTSLNNFKLNYTTTEDKEELEEFIARYDILITSPHRFKEIQKLAGGERQVIPFEYTPDRGSVNLLKMALLDIKQI